MKTNVLKKILLILILLSSSKLYTQEWCLDSAEVLQVRKDYNKLGYLEKADSLKGITIDSLQGRLKTRTERVTNLELDLSKANEQLLLYKQSEGINIEPAIKWQGFYINVIANYAIDSMIITQTFINHFKYALSIDANISIMQKFRLAGELEFNFSSNPIIKLKAGYRIF